MKKQRKPYTPEEKVAILRRHLVEKEPISKLCDELGLQPRVFYRWQKEFFENGAVAFEQKARPNHSAGRFRSSNGRPRWSWPFQPQQIKRVEMLWASAAHEIGELRLAVRAKVNDLAVQHGVVGIQARTKGLASSARTACTVGTELHGMGNKLALNGCKRGDQMYTTSNLGSKMEILAYAAAKPVIQGFQVKP